MLKMYHTGAELSSGFFAFLGALFIALCARLLQSTRAKLSRNMPFYPLFSVIPESIRWRKHLVMQSLALRFRISLFRKPAE
jgi:hypothetical protein